MKPPLPRRMKKGPSRLVELFNLLRDFVVARDISPGIGLVENETKFGREISVSRQLQELAAAYQQIVGGNPDDTNTFITNITGGGNGTGTGLPGVDPGEGETPPSIDGQPLGWQNLHVCVDDGAGGWTPMTMKVYASNPYT